MDVIEKTLLDQPTVYLVQKLISDNLSKTEDGFLVITDAQIARDGKFEYSGAEIYDPHHDLKDEIVTLIRPTEEVFSEKTIASVTTAIVTNGHPAEGRVNSKNSKYLMKGFVSGNVRKADYKDEFGNNLLLCDLTITDESMIQEIENGKRELSIGYNNKMEMIDEDPLRWESRDLIINHIAIVPKGRAKTAFIKDEETTTELIDIKLEDNTIIDIEGGELMANKDEKSYKFRHDGEIVEIKGAILQDEASLVAKEIFIDRKNEKAKKEED